MTTYDHIQELRAELAASVDAGECQQIAAELEQAMVQHAAEEAVFDVLFSAEPPHEGGSNKQAPARCGFPARRAGARFRIGTGRSRWRPERAYPNCAEEKAVTCGKPQWGGFRLRASVRLGLRGEIGRTDP